MGALARLGGIDQVGGALFEASDPGPQLFVGRPSFGALFRELLAYVRQLELEVGEDQRVLAEAPGVFGEESLDPIETLPDRIELLFDVGFEPSLEPRNGLKGQLLLIPDFLQQPPKLGDLGGRKSRRL